MHPRNFPAARPALVLLSGLPGTGKTTFARALAATIDCEHIESDAIRRGLAAAPGYSREESARVFAQAERRAAATLARRGCALVDATNLVRNDRRRFVALARRHEAKLVMVRLTAPEATVRERLGSPRQGHSQAGVAVFAAMQRRPQPFTVPVITVDTRFPLGPSLALVRALVRE